MFIHWILFFTKLNGSQYKILSLFHEIMLKRPKVDDQESFVGGDVEVVRPHPPFLQEFSKRLRPYRVSLALDTLRHSGGRFN